MTSLEDLTQAPIDRPGEFRGYPLTWALEESTKQDSQSVAAAIRFAIDSQWDAENKTWVKYPPGWYVDSRSWIVKKDGNLSHSVIDNLVKAGIWDGNFDAFDEGGAPPAVFALLTVGANEYEGKVTYRVDWINPNADEPQARGGFRPTDSRLLATMRSRFQSQTRALAGGNPAGAPAAPPRPTASGPSLGAALPAGMPIHGAQAPGGFAAPRPAANNVARPSAAGNVPPRPQPAIQQQPQQRATPPQHQQVDPEDPADVAVPDWVD